MFLKYNLVKYKKNNSIFTIFYIFFLIIFSKIIICQITESFTDDILESEGNSIIDIADYFNLYLLVSSSGNIYNGNPLSTTPRATTSASLNASTSAAECNEKFILAACLNDYLLVKINIDDGSFVKLVEYTEFNTIVVSDSSSCCVSIYENIVYIAISQPGSEGKIKNAIIKLYIENKDDINDGPTIDISQDKKLFIFPFEHNKTDTTRDISCEVAQGQNTEVHKLICVYENKDDSIKILNLVTIDFDSDNFEKTKEVDKSFIIEFGFRLYKVDNYNLKLVLRNTVYDVYLDSTFEIKSNKVSNYLKSYESVWNLFSYHNNVVIEYALSFCYYNDGTNYKTSILKIRTIYKDYYSIFLYAHSSEAHKKLYNYYDDTTNYLIITYQSSNSIRYISLTSKPEIYSINCLTSVLRVKSGEQIDFNVSNLIETSVNFGKLYIEKSVNISSSDTLETITKIYPYNALEFPIDKENQKIDLETSDNIWYEFTFAFEERNDDYLIMFSLSNTKLSIHTCAFQCGSCTTDYYTCDTCRDSNYAKKANSNDTIKFISTT